ncbi:hypothetical protein CYMTET_31255 [Cymbomonas tetramitiformis]|uniref:Uncharacterized protein n=1 Tax=Cymbomonas tetramitiformis TaxID=36881 RepID=A0AAE0FH57_9CHLO|nr:hypothetical protein CYMTET_31255 [Cymbomonas tetramitiformis]
MATSSKPGEGSTCAATQPAAPVEDPLFTFGVIADIQYADIDDGASFSGTPRFYRNSLNVLAEAVGAWRKRDVDFAIQLGDIIDVCALLLWDTTLNTKLGLRS